MKKIFLIMLLVFISFSVQAQQDAQYTQYMYNTMSVNPGYAGSRGALSILGLHRAQWVGLDGAPRTQTFSGHMPIENSRIGLGLSFVNDKLGPVSEQYINLDLSYTIPVSEKGKLSLGIKGVANFHKVDLMNETTELTADPLQLNVDRFNPNFGAGVYYHTQKFYAGLSVPNFITTEHVDGVSLSKAQERMNFYAITGYVFEINDMVKLKPTALLKHVEGAPLQADISLNALYNDRFRLGLAYRWSAALSGLAGFQINEKLMIGYAYDWDTTDLGKYNSGSHELFLRFELFNHRDDLISPRFF